MNYSDGNYENCTKIYLNKVFKKYSNIDRLLCEQRCLEKLYHENIFPKILNVNINQKQIIMTRVNGKIIDRKVAICNLDELCGAIEKIHAYKSMQSGYLSDSSSESLKEYLIKKSKVRIDSLKSFIVGTEVIESNVCQNLKNIRFPKTNCLLHYDLKPSNILFDSMSNKFKFVDFDRALYGDPLMDYAKLLWRTIGFSPNNVRDLLKSLTPFYTIDSNFKHRLILYIQLHCIGALSYYVTNKFESYKFIADDALRIIKNTISDGIKVKE